MGGPALPTSCMRLSACTPHHAFGKQACQRAQRGASPLQKRHRGKQRAWPASTASFTPANADGDVENVGQRGRGRLLPVFHAAHCPSLLFLPVSVEAKLHGAEDVAQSRS